MIAQRSDCEAVGVVQFARKYPRRSWQKLPSVVRAPVRGGSVIVGWLSQAGRSKKSVISSLPPIVCSESVLSKARTAISMPAGAS